MSTDIAKKDLTMSERFMNKVIAEFTSGVGELALTDSQKRLAQNYFISLDASLKVAEEKRAKKSEKYRDALPVTWANVNMEELARKVVSAARVGLDPAQKNHVNMMPFKNNAANNYDIVFIDGYRGIELKAKKYGLDIPVHVVVELVYSTDRFKSIKKDRNNQFDSYEFEITNDFDRGIIVGGFYYHMFTDHPEENKLVVMTLKDIEKRKPSYASVEFWGGEKDVWDNGKKVGKEHTDGWYEKMCYKTIYRAAYGDITIDSQKIDDDYMRLRQMELSLSELKVAQEIEENANKEFIDIEYKIAPDESGGSQLIDVGEDYSAAGNVAADQPVAAGGPGF
jgi:recombination protein RecT